MKIRLSKIYHESDIPHDNYIIISNCNCGSHDIELCCDDDIDNKGYFVICNECDKAYGKMSSIEKAISNWNEHND